MSGRPPKQPIKERHCGRELDWPSVRPPETYISRGLERAIGQAPDRLCTRAVEVEKSRAIERLSAGPRITKWPSAKRKSANHQ